jgi:subtilisin family serine protease
VSVVLAALVTLSAVGHGQQPAVPYGGVPQTGAPRQLWPQRPGTPRPIQFDAPRVDLAVQVPAPAPDAPQFVPNEVLVQFKPDASDGDRAAARAAARGAAGRAMRAAGGRLERLTTALAVPDAIAILQALPQVEFAEPNWIVHHAAVSNDPSYTSGQLWGMYGNSTSPANQFGSQAGEAWAAGFTGSNSVYVAVIDEGIDFNHPDLSPNIWTNPFDPIDGVDNDGNGKIDDVHGWDFRDENNTVYDGPVDNHGTHVAGTIGARGGNGAGVAGVNWNVTIISGKFIGPADGSIADAVEALAYVTDLKVRHGLNIVATNNSWTGGAYTLALHQEIIRAAKQGILFVAAAGNGGADLVGDDNDVTPSYPSAYSTLVNAGSETAASYESVIAVAALDMSGNRSSFSNYGAASVDLGAPGSSIHSTLPEGNYGLMSGTSMATPHVTGAAALYKSIFPAATAAQIREAILLQGVATPSMAGITATGKRLNVGDFNSSLSLSINDVRLTEGDGGTKNATFTVSMSGTSGSPVAVNYVTQNVTAASSGSVHANATAISIPTSGAATPYPSTIVVPAGLGSITKVQVTLSGLSHAGAADVDVLLVGPGGQTCVLMSDVTGSASNLTFVFDDTGPVMPGGALVSGTYRPTNNGAGDPFTSPAPPGPHGATLSLFNGTNPEGNWRLFVVDDAAGVSGSVAGGWTLSLTTAPADYAGASGQVTIPAGATSRTIAVAVNGDTVAETTETFKVVLSGALGASIADAEGLATIVNDDFTDPSLSGLPAKAVHIAELRAAINDARAARGLSAFSFTDAITAAQTPIRALHITELRTALNQAYSAATLAPPVYTDPTIVPGVTIVRAAHITELRNAVIALLNTP